MNNFYKNQILWHLNYFKENKSAIINNIIDLDESKINTEFNKLSTIYNFNKKKLSKIDLLEKLSLYNYEFNVPYIDVEVVNELETALTVYGVLNEIEIEGISDCHTIQYKKVKTNRNTDLKIRGIGIEIEFIYNGSTEGDDAYEYIENSYEFRRLNKLGWSAKEDGSLDYNGVEIVSGMGEYSEGEYLEVSDLKKNFSELKKFILSLGDDIKFTSETGVHFHLSFNRKLHPMEIFALIKKYDEHNLLRKVFPKRFKSDYAGTSKYLNRTLTRAVVTDNLEKNQTISSLHGWLLERLERVGINFHGQLANNKPKDTIEFRHGSFYGVKKENTIPLLASWINYTINSIREVSGIEHLELNRYVTLMKDGDKIIVVNKKPIKKTDTEISNYLLKLINAEEKRRHFYGKEVINQALFDGLLNKLKNKVDSISEILLTIKGLYGSYGNIKNKDAIHYFLRAIRNYYKIGPFTAGKNLIIKLKDNGFSDKVIQIIMEWD